VDYYEIADPLAGSEDNVGVIHLHSWRPSLGEADVVVVDDPIVMVKCRNAVGGRDVPILYLDTIQHSNTLGMLAAKTPIPKVALMLRLLDAPIMLEKEKKRRSWRSWGRRNG